MLFLPGPTFSLSEEDILAGAQERIEQYRKADGAVHVVGEDGQPVPGALIEIEQTRHAFLFGCSLLSWGHWGDTGDEETFRRLFSNLFNYATLPFYWWVYEPKRGETTEDYIRDVVSWCEGHGISTKGHPLVWNHTDPAWLPDSTQEVHDLQIKRVSDCVTRFAGTVDSWDVVNEATTFGHEDSSDVGPKMTRMWREVGREQLVREAFEAARKANPSAQLLINDYRKGEDYFDLLNGMRDEDSSLLFDAIGIQSHMHGYLWTVPETWETVERFAKFGVPIHFTEVTIVSGGEKHDAKEGEERWPSEPRWEWFQAREAARLYTLLFSNPSVEAITWWDLTDRRSYLGAPAGLVRKDWSEKPAYRQLENLIKRKWWTKTSNISKTDGTARFRGFLGDYSIRVSKAGYSAEDVEIQLSKGGENTISVNLSLKPGGS